ncbi:MAG: adenylate/guanylate cyclase domain-containing protein, partial [Pseudomonadota bacterium]
AFPHAMLAAIYAELDRSDDARAEVEALLERSPEYSLEQFAKGRFYKNPDDLTRVLDALRKAGVPET